MLSANQFAPIRSSNTASPTNRVVSSALEKSKVLKTTPGYLTDLLIYNSSASTIYAMIFDATSVPADGALPASLIAILPVATKTTAKLDGFVTALPFGVGLTVAASSTDTTVTAIATSAILYTAIVL